MIASLKKLTIDYVGNDGQPLVQLFDDFSFDIPRSSFVAIIGNSGSGKSTLLDFICGFLPQNGGMMSKKRRVSGEIWINDKNVTSLFPHERSLSRVMQNGGNIYPHMTVEQNLEFPLKLKQLSAVERKKQIEKTLFDLGIYGLRNRRPSQISGGQRQRVAIGKALITRPKLALLDEPFSGLDPFLRKQLGDLIAKEFIEEGSKIGSSVIMVTHHLEVAKIADVVILLRSSEDRAGRQKTTAETFEGGPGKAWDTLCDLHHDWAKLL